MGHTTVTKLRAPMTIVVTTTTSPNCVRMLSDFQYEKRMEFKENHVGDIASHRDLLPALQSEERQ